MHFFDGFADALNISFSQFKEGQIDEPFLDVYLSKADDDFAAFSEYLNFTWNVTEVNGNFLRMQLYWNNTEYISNGQTWDTLVFQFKSVDQYFWLGAKFEPMKDVEVVVDVPNQIDLSEPGHNYEHVGVYIANAI